MGKGQSNIPKYPHYDTLVYFRWKALIRSKEYLEFYETVDDLASEKSDLEHEIQNKEENLIGDYFNDDVELYSLSSQDLLEYLKKHRISSDINDADIDEYEMLLDGMATLIEREEKIISAAEQNFGLLMWTKELDNLRPVDKPIEKLNISFKDYLPSMPTGHIRDTYENIAVQELKYKNGMFSFFDKLDSIEDVMVHQTLEEEGLLLFCIHPQMPFSLIVEALRKKLSGDIKSRAGRKDFEPWEEAFEVWDIYQKVKNVNKRRDFLSETARLMGEKTLFPYWKGHHGGNHALKYRVRDKVKVAEKLINLAGKGQFPSLSPSYN